LEAHLDRDHQIGHSYLMNLTTVADLRFAWEHKVMPLLQEYFYGDDEKLLAVLGEDFMAEEKIPLGDADDAEERVVYRMREMESGDDLVKALKGLADTGA
jgi:5-methylcytosine-specific restriction protein B